ncbi:MAG: triose-phosphate isomerase [Phycisphaerales bacterium]
MSARRPFVAGNWKMNPNLSGATALSAALGPAVREHLDHVDVGACPTHLHLPGCAPALREAGVLVGAQDAYPGDTGAFTGEVSVEMLKEFGVAFVLTGHSERRHILGDSDDMVREKTHAVLDAGLGCILCIGEKIEEREAGQTDAVNARQLTTALEGVDEGVARERLTIAYEPVWAIGTGKTATPADAQDAHAKIRAVLAGLFSQETADAIRIQYGGSMKPENAADLLAQPDIDGGLIGGAALKADAFAAIVGAAAGIAHA